MSFLSMFACVCDLSEYPEAAPDGRARIRNEDGSVSYAIDPVDIPTEPVVEGALTWTYVGQARLSDAPPTSWGTVRGYVGGPARSMRDQVMGMRRFDELGREWVVTDVDLEMLCRVQHERYVRNGTTPPPCNPYAVVGGDPIVEAEITYMSGGTKASRRRSRRAPPRSR